MSAQVEETKTICINEPVYTTLAKIKSHGPCSDGWRKLLASLGKTQADDEPLTFSRILESNGLSDALWCLRTVALDHPERFRLFLGSIVERVAAVWEKWAKDSRPNDRHLIREIANELKAGNKPVAVWRAAAAAADAADAADAAAVWRAADAAAVWRAADAAAREEEREFQRKLLIQIFG
jgi:hypothetical protein